MFVWLSVCVCVCVLSMTHFRHTGIQYAYTGRLCYKMYCVSNACKIFPSLEDTLILTEWERFKNVFPFLGRILFYTIIWEKYELLVNSSEFFLENADFFSTIQTHWYILFIKIYFNQFISSYKTDISNHSLSFRISFQHRFDFPPFSLVHLFTQMCISTEQSFYLIKIKQICVNTGIRIGNWIGIRNGN